MILGAGLSSLPFMNSSGDIIFFFYLLARVGGLFLVAPLLSNKAMTTTLRIFLTVMTTALLAMVLYPEYRGPTPTFILGELTDESSASMLLLTLTLVKELSIGFLIGFAFIIIYEATLLAGQVIGVMMGFSITEILDPVSNVSQGLLGQMFSLGATLVIISLDLHHQFLRVLSESFTVLPLGQYHLPYEMLQTVTHGTGRLFQYGFKIAAIPFTVIGLVTVALGFMAKVMPEMNIFMVAFPLRIFVGYYALLISMSFFPQVLRQAFVEFNNLAVLFVKHLASGS